VPQGSATSGLDFDEAELGLGARLGLQNGRGYNGLMDDVSIWDKALQPSSIRKLASGVSPKDVVDSPVTEPPTIFAQPSGATVILGEPATFSVTARGAGTLTYQWQKGGASLAGATNNPFSIAAAGSADAGEYLVLVANAFGSQTSQVARLIVDPGVPVIVNLVPSTGSFEYLGTGAAPDPAGAVWNQITETALAAASVPPAARRGLAARFLA
jgi:hypothetical protein